MVPFTSREDVDFFLHLEMHMRQDHPPLAGRDHLAYRGAFTPVKDTIDGDLCEQFSQVGLARTRGAAAAAPLLPGAGVGPSRHGCMHGPALPDHQLSSDRGCAESARLVQMPLDKQRSIAEQLDRTPGEVLKKLEDLRNKLL